MGRWMSCTLKFAKNYLQEINTQHIRNCLSWAIATVLLPDCSIFLFSSSMFCSFSSMHHTSIPTSSFLQFPTFPLSLYSIHSCIHFLLVISCEFLSDFPGTHGAMFYSARSMVVGDNHLISQQEKMDSEKLTVWNQATRFLSKQYLTAWVSPFVSFIRCIPRKPGAVCLPGSFLEMQDLYQTHWIRTWILVRALLDVCTYESLRGFILQIALSRVTKN